MARKLDKYTYQVINTTYSFNIVGSEVLFLTGLLARYTYQVINTTYSLNIVGSEVLCLNWSLGKSSKICRTTPHRPYISLI